MTKDQPIHNDECIHPSSHTEQSSYDNHNRPIEPKSWPELPPWANFSMRSTWGEKLNIREWDDGNVEDDPNDDDSEDGNRYHDRDATEYRLSNGWKGNDLVHSRSSPVRVLEYRLFHDVANTNADSMQIIPTLTGLVHFTKRAESHKGYCHGGSMCSILDDIIGWTGFCVTGTCIPWSGFTVQVNSKLCKPVPVGSILKIVSTVEKIQGRKVWVKAYLIDPVFGEISRSRQGGEEKDLALHAIGEGLVILNKGVSEEI